MSERQTPKRTQEHEIAIDASVEAVWAAITDAEELTRWFVETAKVEPGVGGTFTISWGPGEEGGSTIQVWEPNRCLRVALGLSELGAAKIDKDSPITEEYTIERRDGKTVLRLVQSNIPNTKEWDGFYDGTDSGWESFFRTLRHYLEHHPGKARTVIKVVGKLPGTSAEAWARLVAPSGLGFDPVAGRAFSARTGAGESISGEVVAVKSPNHLELTIREFGDALLAHSMSGGGANHFVYSMLSVYGKSAPEVEAIRAKWQAWLTSVLGL